MKSYKQGFSAVEIIISVAIIAILSTIGTIAFRDSLINKNLESIADKMVSKIELAKTNAMSGKNGEQYGIKFDPSSYIYFRGSSFSASDPDNREVTIDEKFQIGTNIPSTDQEIIFSRITGDTNYNNDITVEIFQKSDPINKMEIIIGNLGEISVVK